MSGGGVAIDEISHDDVLAMLRPVEDRGSLVMAKRLRQHVDQIYQWAYRGEAVKVNPAADVGMDLTPRPRSKVKRRARLPAGEMGAFLDKVRAYDGDEITRLALETVVRTAVRTSELRLATWREVEGDLWRIPADHMKMGGLEHLVPLAPQVKKLLRRAKVVGKGSPLLFPGDRGRPLSLNTLIYAIYRLGYRSRATVHGMRSVFSTWANEQGRWHADAVERQLAHWPRDEIRSAYNAAEYLPARREILVEWNRWLDLQADFAEVLG